jgi:hypothetical protein
MNIIDVKDFGMRVSNLENAKKAVGSTSHAGLLKVAENNGIPVSAGKLPPNVLGQYSLRVQKNKLGQVVGVKDRKIELDTDKHPDAEKLGATLAHELKHADDELINDYCRHGTAALFTALDYLTGNVIGDCKDRHTSEDYVKVTIQPESP